LGVTLGVTAKSDRKKIMQTQSFLTCETATPSAASLLSPSFRLETFYSRRTRGLRALEVNRRRYWSVEIADSVEFPRLLKMAVPFSCPPKSIDSPEATNCNGRLPKSFDSPHLHRTRRSNPKTHHSQLTVAVVFCAFGESLEHWALIFLQKGLAQTAPDDLTSCDFIRSQSPLEELR
jgi:hypothetical protein